MLLRLHSRKLPRSRSYRLSWKRSMTRSKCPPGTSNGTSTVNRFMFWINQLQHVYSGFCQTNIVFKNRCFVSFFYAFNIRTLHHFIFTVFLSNTCQEYRRHTAPVSGSVSALPGSDPTPRPRLYTSGCGSGTRLT